MSTFLRLPRLSDLYGLGDDGQDPLSSDPGADASASDGAQSSVDTSNPGWAQVLAAASQQASTLAPVAASVANQATGTPALSNSIFNLLTRSGALAAPGLHAGQASVAAPSSTAKWVAGGLALAVALGLAFGRKPR